MIWNRIPKTTYVGLSQFQLGIYDAVAHFNIGRKAAILIYEKLGLIPGHYTIEGCHKINKRRLNAAAWQALTTVKNRRKQIRGKNKKKQDRNIEKEGPTYGPGEF